LASSSSIRVLLGGSLALKNINLSIKKGELIGIGGRIGSGKSTLLSLLLDEIPFYSGKVLKKGSIAYVEQEPIMFSATIRENIIFGTKFNEDLYRYVLRKSCFSDDLKIL
jgi:ATP-binding cassette subfamily C (CFTR/MRP) protein 4